MYIPKILFAPEATQNYTLANFQPYRNHMLMYH